MDIELIIPPVITNQEYIEFSCLIPFLLKEIKEQYNFSDTPSDTHSDTPKRKKQERKSIEIYRLKNKAAVKNWREEKKLFKKLLEEKIIQFKKQYKSLTGKEFYMNPFEIDIELEDKFQVDPSLSRRERCNISTRKCRYIQKMHTIYLEKELKLLQKEIVKLS